MSGPKVVRIVTREEIEAICQRHIAVVGAAANELRRRAQRCGMLDGALEAAVAARLAAFAAMLNREQWMDIQKGAPEAVAFLQAEAARLEASATAAAAARHRGCRAANAARSVAGALEAAGVAAPTGLRPGGQPDPLSRSHHPSVRPDRLARLIFVMALALYLAVSTGQWDALHHATPAESRRPERRPKNVLRSMMAWFTRGLRRIANLLQTPQPFPQFWSIIATDRC